MCDYFYGADTRWRLNGLGSYSCLGRNSAAELKGNSAKLKGLTKQLSSTNKKFKNENEKLKKETKLMECLKNSVQKHRTTLEQMKSENSKHTEKLWDDLNELQEKLENATKKIQFFEGIQKGTIFLT